MSDLFKVGDLSVEAGKKVQGFLRFFFFFEQDLSFHKAKNNINFVFYNILENCYICKK